jgi:hypothetical protein
MCIGNGAKVVGMEGSDKCFEVFLKLSRVKLVRWRNCREQNFSMQDVHHGIVDGGSSGCKIYNNANPRINGYKVG